MLRPLFNASYAQFLTSQKPTVIQEDPLHSSGSILQSSFNGAVDDSDVKLGTPSVKDIIIPPLNTDARFAGVLPMHDMTSAHDPKFHKDHPHWPHIDEIIAENFSWSEFSRDDSAEIRSKKKLIQPVGAQSMCGSCWSFAIAGCFSDCLVVSGAVTWMPRIAPTYIMMVVPSNRGNGQCNGGNPAAVCSALEEIPVSDTTCIDYSWCSNDKEMCTSAASASHFQSNFGSKLNENIPKALGKDGGCYFSKKHYLYKLDKNSNVIYIGANMISTDDFRKTIKSHIVDFGPVVAGYIVLRNFLTGNHTDMSVNEGIYFDRADYRSSVKTGADLHFSDYNTAEDKITGLHAVAVVGWGVSKEPVFVDNGRREHVQFWIARNSWSSAWGNQGGYFRIAMYPWNRVAQFDIPSNVKGSKIGGMILIRATRPPTVGDAQQIMKESLDRITRMQSTEYYQMTPDMISGCNLGVCGEPHTTSWWAETAASIKMWVFVVVGLTVVVLFIVLRRKQLRGH